MCLAVPVQVIEIRDGRAVVETGGNRVEADLSLVDDVAVGDYVILHAGFAIQRYDPEEARETLDMMRQMLGGEAS